jgi:hypothetical protein
MLFLTLTLLSWTAVTAIVVAACQVASRADSAIERGALEVGRAPRSGLLTLAGMDAMAGSKS